MKRAKTIKLQGNDYAAVAERIKLFREDCPNGDINTTWQKESEDSTFYVFQTSIVKDLKDKTSAKSNGFSRGELKEKKAFEKLETISVGRALAKLGYLGSGDVASFEEMEDFLSDKEERLAREAIEYKEKVIDDLRSCKDLEVLRTTFVQSKLTNDADIVRIKDEMKDKLTEKEEK